MNAIAVALATTNMYPLAGPGFSHEKNILPNVLCGNLRFMLQGQPDVVEAFEQAMAHEIVDLKVG